MVDLVFIRNVSGLRRLKWLCTLTASVALMVAGGVTINWFSSLDSYHWSTVPLALTTAAIALGARYLIGQRLGDKTKAFRTTTPH